MPHFCLFGRRLCLKLYQGKITQPLHRLPRTAWGWKEGQTLAYLIDFMAEDKKSIDFRIHYQDAASNPPRGFPPPFVDPRDKKRVDVTILCVPGFNEVENYPEALIQKMRPIPRILSKKRTVRCMPPSVREAIRYVLLDFKIYLTSLSG